MTRLSIACVLASASAFLGARAPLPVKTPRVVKAPAVAMSSALAEESGVSLSSGGGMFTTSSPEDRRIGTELFVSGVRYRERRYPEVKSAHRPQRCAEASKASTAAPRGASAARGAPVTKSSGAERRLAGERERSPIQRNVIESVPHTCDRAKASTRRQWRWHLWPRHEADAVAAAGRNRPETQTTHKTIVKLTDQPRRYQAAKENPTGARAPLKVVYVVLESQYQSSMSAAVKAINDNENSGVACECVGYLLEELRDPANAAAFKKDVEEANVFIGSLIFVQELAELVKEVVEAERDRLDAVLIFPSMPEVMRLNKVGGFTMASLGQSKSVVSEFMKKKKADDGSSFEEAMLKLLRTLPKVLKYLPGDKAKDARSFMMSLQYWLGGSPENIEALLLNLASNYVAPIVAQGKLTAEELIAPEVIPDKGIWHPVAPRVFDTLDEYMTWLRTEHAPSLGIDVDTAPLVGVVLQKSHINTRDDAHYVALIMEMEAKGALVVPTYTGSLDFSLCVDSYFFNAAGKVTRLAPHPTPARPYRYPTTT